ncbi:MAG TPA: hypothetical protein V6D08_16375 [Candidatus Obscuribacterales bacterium]
MVESRFRDEAPEVKNDATDSTSDASARLRDDVFTDAKKAGSDRVAERGDSTANKNVDNPYDHIGFAGTAIRELDALKGKKDDEKVTLTDDKGNIREVTVKERRAELERFVEKELKQGISAADRIDRDKVETSLWEVRTKQSNAKSLAEFDALTRQENVLEAMKHASSVTRFAYATYLADKGDMVQSKVYLDQIARIDREARLDPIYQQLTKAVEASFTGKRSEVTTGGAAEVKAGDDPFVLLGSATEKRQKGDAAGAEADYKKAIEAAGKLDPQLVKSKLEEIEQAKKANANDPQVLEQLKGMELAIGHAKSIAMVNYAEFLMEQKRSDEAKKLLEQVAKDDPQLVKDNPEFQQLTRAADQQKKAQEPFDNPYEHLKKFQEHYEKGDLKAAKAELEASVKAADKIDRKLVQENKKVVAEAIKELQQKPESQQDKQEIERLQGLLGVYEGLDRAAAATRLALGKFELAGKNYNSAHQLFEEVQRIDPEYAKSPEVKMDELLEASKEPSTWGKVWGWTKDILKELVCDAAAILAGVGAAVLTGWSGPAAVGVGAVAGAATYTAMKTLVFGEKFHWSMPIWGAIDGASGGLAAIARTGLTKVGGKIVAKEAAESALVATGKNVAVIEGMEGLKMGQTAHAVAKEGLKQMGKELSFGTRLLSKIPFTSLGSAEYRAAMNATNALGRRVMLGNFVRDAGTAGTVSLVYRGAHGGYDWLSGKQDFGTFAKSYAFGVVGDSVGGGVIGPMGRWLGTGIGRVPGVDRVAGALPGLGAGMDTALTASGPRWYEAYSTHEYLTKQVEPTYKYHQVPLDLQKNKREFMQRYSLVDQLQHYQGPEPYKIKDGLQPTLDGGGNVVTPDENFDAEAALRGDKKKDLPE